MNEIVREYLLIGLGLGQIEEGIVDAYYGPAEVAEEARRAKAAPLELAERAERLRERLPELDDAQREHWLDRQLVALATLSRRLAGEELPYLDEVELCFDARPEATPPEEYAQTRIELEDLVPGSGDLRTRLAERDKRLTVPVNRLPQVIDWVLAEQRRDASRQFEVPAGEQLTVSLVNDKPWSAYNWYHGNLRSLIEYNTDLPVRATALVGTLAHEAFPGHHLEHASKEANLVLRLDRPEASLQLINTPEAYISEGLAEAGVRFVAPAQRWQELLIGACAIAGMAMTPTDAEREWQTSQSLRRLGGASGDAALQMHVGGRSREEVVAFLEHDALVPRDRAEKSLEFLTHPLWRTYVFCYEGGERLLTRWLDAAGSEEGARRRFARLLNEQLTPSGIEREIASEASAPA